MKSLSLVFALLFTADPTPKALNVLIYLSGGPGDSKAAEKPLKSFFSLWEKQASLADGTLQGAYFPQREPAIAYASSSAPTVFMLPVATFIEFEKAWNLQPLAEVALKGAPIETWYVVVKKEGGPADVAALKGKTVSSSLVADAKLSELVELEDGTRLSKHATITYERSPLAAMRQVRDGSTAAVLLDEAQWAGLEKLPFGSELRLLAKTKPLPRPIVAVRKGVDKATMDKLKRGLLALGADPDAKAALQQFSVDSVVAPDEAALAAARKRAQKK